MNVIPLSECDSIITIDQSPTLHIDMIAISPQEHDKVVK